MLFKITYAQAPSNKPAPNDEVIIQHAIIVNNRYLIEEVLISPLKIFTIINAIVIIEHVRYSHCISAKYPTKPKIGISTIITLRKETCLKFGSFGFIIDYF